jgi:hypothetical protein
MGALIAEHVESKSLNFEFFWKDVKMPKMLQIY